jgi:hypothetical protein
MSARKVKERWTVDFWFEHASGKRERVRKAAPVTRGVEPRSSSVSCEWRCCRRRRRRR